MMISIILNEWKILVRNRSIVYVSLVFMLSIISVVWMGNLQSKNQSQAQIAAEKHIRAQWDNLEPMNPHRAAHYGVCLLYTSPSPRDLSTSRMPSSA